MLSQLIFTYEAGYDIVIIDVHCARIHAIFKRVSQEQTQAMIHPFLIPFSHSLISNTNIKRNSPTIPLLHGDRLGQISREINIQALGNCEPVCHQLERNNVQKTLQAVNGLGYLDFLGLASLELFIARIADNNRSASTSNNCMVLVIDQGTWR